MHLKPGQEKSAASTSNSKHPELLLEHDHLPIFIVYNTIWAYKRKALGLNCTISMTSIFSLTVTRGVEPSPSGE